MTDVYVPQNLKASNEPLYFAEGLIKQDAAIIPAWTPLMLETSGSPAVPTGKIVRWDKTKPATAFYLNPFDIDAKSADSLTLLVKTGSFKPAPIQWPAGTTDAQKQTAFAGATISVITKV